MVSYATIGLGYVIQNVGSCGGDPNKLSVTQITFFVVGSEQILHIVHIICYPYASWA